MGANKYECIIWTFLDKETTFRTLSLHNYPEYSALVLDEYLLMSMYLSTILINTYNTISQRYSEEHVQLPNSFLTSTENSRS